MRNFLRSGCGMIFLVLLSKTLSAQTVYTLNWASSFSPAWANAATSGSATNIGGSGINCSVTMTASGGAFTTNGGGFNTPTVANTAFVVAGSTANNQIDMQFTVNTQFTDIVFTFSSPISNVKFNIADLDKVNATATSYYDKVIVTGTNGSLSYNPVIAKYVPTSNFIFASGNNAYANSTSGQGGNSASSTADQNGSVTVDFGTATLQTITIRYTNFFVTGTNPDVTAKQAISIGNLSFQRVNLPPVANNFINIPMPQGYPATAIPALSATDADGTIASYTITAVPTALQGTLSIPCPPTPTSASCSGGFADLTPAVLAANSGTIVLTAAQAAGLRFDPVANFTGNASFTFIATDNYGLISNTATYILPVIAQPPVSNNIMENSMPNTNAATAIQSLNSSDADGTIATYQLTSLPSVVQGVLSVPCPPNLTGGTCSGGFEDLTATVLSNYPSGIPLTATQAAGMRFDPAPGFVGNASFNYNAVDNSGNTSNTANYTIPVAATATTKRPPLADNITSQSINNSLGNTAIPALQAVDLDGTVTTYTIATIPSASAGVLRISCPSTPSGLTCSAGFADIIAGTVLTPAEATRLFFDPAATFTGTGSFTYTATDNTSLVSNTATYNLPVVNTAPVSSNIKVTVPFNGPVTNIPALTGSDADGTIAGYTITSVPTALQGTLSIPCPPTPTSASCAGGFANLTPAVLTANSGNIALTPTQAAGLRFIPATNFSGSAPFTYTSTDNNGNISAAANYTITVVSQPPITTDFTNASIPNAAAATAISGLTATDPDGTIASYILYTIPTTTQGVLSVPCPATFTGATCTAGFQDLTATILANYPAGIPLTTVQAAGLRFDPVAGNAQVGSFTFAAVDNSGYISNTSNFYIPVTGAGNIPPVASNITLAGVSNILGPTSITGLAGTDADGTVTGYTITSVPTAAQGTLSIPCPATPTGATCTGGFADLTPAVLAANPAGIVLTTTQAAGLRFDPTTGYSGPVNFTYTATDNSGALSTNANYYIPVTSIAPVANAVIAPAMSHNNSATAIPALSVTDADGTIASYSIESLPPATQGTLSIPCPPTLTGATCTGGFQDLTAAVLTNYSNGGIPLTPTQMAGLRFAPAVGYTGNVVFAYHGTDNSGLISNTSTYTISITGLPPVSNEVRAQKMLNSSPATAIPTLNSSDPDGTISSYIITSVPPASQGVISIPCPPTPTGATCTGGFANLTAAVLTANPGGISLTATQAAGLRFAPNASYNGTVIFNFAAFDNNGNTSNIAAYILSTGTFTALPLSLINFSGVASGTDVLLTWNTENESNMASYDVEYSTNGVSFTYAGTVPAYNGNNNTYHFTVTNFTAPTGYFRLKCINRDGSFTYSTNLIIKQSQSLKKSITVIPNPATDHFQVKISSDITTTADVQVTSTTGQVIYRQKLLLYKGDNLLPMQYLAAKLSNGTYIVRSVVAGQVLSAKFVVKK